MQILVGSSSPRKIAVARTIFERYFSDTVCADGRDIASGVSDTPYDEETLLGARNRARGVREDGKADFYVGLESGLVERYGQLFEEAWAVVIEACSGTEYVGYSSGLPVPNFVQRWMTVNRQAHAVAMESIRHNFSLFHVNQEPSDTWLTYTGGTLTREVGLEEAMRNAIVQLLRGPTNLYRWMAPV